MKRINFITSLAVAMLFCISNSSFAQEHQETETVKKEKHVIKSDSDDQKVIIKKIKKVKKEGEKKKIKKKAYKIVKKENGVTTTIEWDGTGEMPKEMKEMLSKNDLSDELHEVHGSNPELESDDKEEDEEMKTIDVEVEMDEEGNEEKEVIIKIVDENGNMEKTKIYTDQDKKVIKTKDGTKVMVEVEEEDKNPNKVQLGIIIENAESGVRILDSVEGTEAATSGVEEGDVITAVNGVKVRTMEQLIEQVGKYKAGEVVRLLINREGERKEIDVKLSPRN